MSVIFSIFTKKEGNSRAIGRIFSRNRGNSSLLIRHIFRAKVSINNIERVDVLCDSVHIGFTKFPGSIE